MTLILAAGSLLSAIAALAWQAAPEGKKGPPTVPSRVRVAGKVMESMLLHKVNPKASEGSEEESPRG
jgi:hypothetical protein